jgi:chaperone required for assembly of F1-ATPase
MREIFEDLFKNEPLDPVEAARRTMRPQARKRFYASVGIAEGEGGAFALVLDGRPVKTPARRALAAPTRPLAGILAQEWTAQADVIEPASMPLTRLANSIIDGVAEAPDRVAADIAKYLGCDLLFYRASTPEGLVARQTAAWDPLIAWARETLGARFVLAEGLAHVQQPETALTAGRLAIHTGGADARSIWRLGALHSVTTLTGSALIALALAHGRLSVDEAWAAAHVDEDWNMQQWGEDSLELERRAYREAEMRAAVTVIDALRD